MKRFFSIVVLLAVLLTSSAVQLSSAATHAGPGSSPSAEGDSASGPDSGLNADGYTDLAIGVPYEDIGTVGNAGGVNIVYGSAHGLTQAGNQSWNQDTPGLAGEAEYQDEFGADLAAGDFNADGYADLAIGRRGEHVGAVENAGAVSILYGTASGLSATGNQSWNQNDIGTGDAAGAFDGFGSALTVGDFNADGYADLAVGVRGENVGSVQSAGAVNILYGSSSGLSANGAQGWNQDTTGIAGVAEELDGFGSALAAGDFNADGYADLAIGVRDEHIETKRDAGAVNILYGSSSGLSATGNQVWSQDTPGVAGVAEEWDGFGSALTVGDFNADGYADLAAGVWGEDLRSGAVNILYGSSSGLSATGSQIWSQATPGILGDPEAGDEFGSALAAGDFNADGYVDLAAGARGESIGTVGNAGAVNILYGSSAGLSDTGNQIWSQESAGIYGTADLDDRFGAAVAAGDFNADGYADLAVGVWGEDIGAVGDAGGVHLLYGSASGLSATGSWFLSQDSPGIADEAERWDEFGYALAAFPIKRLRYVYLPLVLHNSNNR